MLKLACVYIFVPYHILLCRFANAQTQSAKVHLPSSVRSSVPSAANSPSKFNFGHMSPQLTSLCSSFHIFSRKTKLVSFATASAIARRLRDFSRSWRISCLEMLLPFFLVTFADPRVHRLTDSSSQYGISASLQPLAMSESGSPQPDAEHVVNTRDSPKTQRSTINKKGKSCNYLKNDIILYSIPVFQTSCRNGSASRSLSIRNTWAKSDHLLSSPTKRPGGTRGTWSWYFLILCCSACSSKMRRPFRKHSHDRKSELLSTERCAHEVAFLCMGDGPKGILYSKEPCLQSLIS